MAVKNYLDKTGLALLWAKIVARINAMGDLKVDKAEGYSLMSDAEREKLTNIEAGGQVNVIETVQLDGVAIEVTDPKTVNIDVAATYATKAALATAEQTAASNLAAAKTELEGKITTAQSELTQDIADAKQEMEDSLNEFKNDISTAYQFVGSVADMAALEALDTSALRVGDVYNVTFDGTDHGANYAWDGTEWDKLGGTVDLTAYSTSDQIAAVYQRMDELVAITETEIDEVCV